MSDSRDLIVVILAGGRGTRLRSVVSDVPKPLAPIRDTPYLVVMLHALYEKGIRRVVLSVGYMAEAFDPVVDQLAKQLPDLSVSLVKEPSALGTGGALRLVAEQHRAEHYMVMNGDSFCDFDLDRLLSTNSSSGSAMVCVRVEDISRYGEVQIDDENRVLAFKEKQDVERSGWINAGMYFVPREIVLRLPLNETLSLERDMVPYMLDQGLVAYPVTSEFIDIGIPEDYRRMDESPNDYFPNLADSIWRGV